MEAEGSLPHSQVPATCPNPKPDRDSPQPHILLPEDLSSYDLYLLLSYHLLSTYLVAYYLRIYYLLAYYLRTYYLHTYLRFTYLLTHSMEQSPSWEANRFSASQEILRIYGTRRFIATFTSTHHLSLS